MNKQSIRTLLHSFPIFKDLTNDEIEPIVNISKQRKYENGEHIFLQGEKVTNVYFIYEGNVKIYKSDIHGKEQIVHILQSGNMFPHQGLFRKDNYPAHAKALNDVILVNIPIKPFEQTLITYPEVCIKLFRVLGDIIADLQNRLEEKILHNSYEQIIMLLLRLAKSHGKAITGNQFILTTQFTNLELANMIGSSRETVSRTLTQFRKSNFIVNDENGFIIINQMALQNAMA